MAFIRKIKRGKRIYLAEVESYRDGVQVKQKVLRYLGPDPVSSDLDLTFKTSDINVSSVKVFGPVIILESIARELGFYEILGDVAPQILALVFGHCLEYRSVNDAKHWYETTDLASVMGSPKITVETIHNAIESLSKKDTSQIQKSIFENLQEKFGVDTSGVIYDVTNTHLNGTQSELAKKGKDKEGVRGRRIIQIGLGITRELGLPIFHHARPGNIHDIKMFKEAINQFLMMKLKPGLVVYDRGMTGKTCVSEIHKLGWRSLAGMPMHKGIRSLISKMDIQEIEKMRYLVPVGSCEMFVKPIAYDYGEVRGKLMIILNTAKRQHLISERRMSIAAARDDFNINGITIPEDLIEYFSASCRIDWHAIKRAEQYDGLSFIFTDAKITAYDSIKIYFAKDIVERCFKLEKSVAKLRPIRFWLDQKISSHILICHFALALLTTCRIRLEKIGINEDISYVLRNLGTIYKIYFIANSQKIKKLETHFSKVNTMSDAQIRLIKALAPKISI